MPRFGVKMRIAPCEVEMFCPKCGLIKEKFLFTIPCVTKIKKQKDQYLLRRVKHLLQRKGFNLDNREIKNHVYGQRQT